jgi:hypothetical protein
MGYLRTICLPRSTQTYQEGMEYLRTILICVLTRTRAKGFSE